VVLTVSVQNYCLYASHREEAQNQKLALGSTTQQIPCK